MWLEKYENLLALFTKQFCFPTSFLHAYNNILQSGISLSSLLGEGGGGTLLCFSLGIDLIL